MADSKKKRKVTPLSELNLMNRFLFSEAMEDPENVVTLLEIILGRKLDTITKAQTEKEEKIDTLSKMARLDLFVEEADGTSYNLETQIRNTHNLPKRSRHYHGNIDARLLEPGDVDYNKMIDTYVIMICSFDPFGKGRYMYTFEMTCKEDFNLALGDGATRIFLNTKGKNKDEVSPELIELLKYMENTTSETAESCSNPEIMKMHQRIAKIKASEEVNVKYMKEWEERELDKKEAREEGREEGRQLGFTEANKNTALRLYKKQHSVDEIADILETSVEVVEGWLGLVKV